MPRITEIAFCLPTDLIVTFDRDGGHPWKGATPDEKPPAGALRLVYNPGWFTKDYQNKLRDVQADETRAGAIFQFLQMVAQWDLQDAKGKAIPLTEEALAPLPYAVMNGCIQAIFADLEPPKSGD